MSEPHGTLVTLVTAALTGALLTFNVVNAGDVLHMPGYDAQLLASDLTTTAVVGPAVNSTDYPGGRGLLVSFEISVTNQGTVPLEFDQTATDIDLLIPPTSDPRDEFSRPQIPYPQGAPSPQAGAPTSRLAARRRRHHETRHSLDRNFS